MLRTMFIFALAVATEAGITCRANEAVSIQKNFITTWTCDRTPIPYEMRWEVTNLYGWTLSTFVSTGGNGCTGGSPQNQYQPEGTIFNHRLRNATASTIGCPDFPCCLRIRCEGVNNGDCTNIGVKADFLNLQSMTDDSELYLVKNSTTVLAAD